MDSNVSKVVGGIVAFLLCLSCVLILGAGALIAGALPSNVSSWIPVGNPTASRSLPQLDGMPIDP